MQLKNGKLIYDGGFILISEISAISSYVDIYECEAYDEETTYFRVHLKNSNIITLPEYISNLFSDDVNLFIKKLGI